MCIKTPAKIHLLKVMSLDLGSLFDLAYHTSLGVSQKTEVALEESSLDENSWKEKKYLPFVGYCNALQVWFTWGEVSAPAWAAPCKGHIRSLGLDGRHHSWKQHAGLPCCCLSNRAIQKSSKRRCFQDETSPDTETWRSDEVLCLVWGSWASIG